MKTSINRLFKRPNLWIVSTIILFNLFAWYRFLLPESEPYVVNPIRDPEVVTLLDYIRSGDHSGETWEVTLTELEAEQTITWYIQRYNLPFRYPEVTITPDYIECKGKIIFPGSDSARGMKVRGKGRITLENELPIVEILELNLPIPGPLKDTIEQTIQSQVADVDRFHVRFTKAEWREGEVIVRGYIQ